MKSEEQVLACNLTAIPADARAQHLANLPEIFGAAQAMHELPDGYAFQFENEPGRVMALAHFMEYERLCCPFERLAVELEPNGGPIWLRMTGGAGVKEMLTAGFRDLHQAAGYIQHDPGDALQATVDQIAPRLATLLEEAAPAHPE